MCGSGAGRMVFHTTLAVVCSWLGSNSEVPREKLGTADISKIQVRDDIGWFFTMLLSLQTAPYFLSAGQKLEGPGRIPAGESSLRGTWFAEAAQELQGDLLLHCPRRFCRTWEQREYTDSMRGCCPG